MVAAIGLGAAALGSACSASNGGRGQAGVGGGNAIASNGAGGQPSSGSGLGGGSFAGVTGTATGPGAGGGCASTSSKAQLAPLDIYVMLDQSLSMTDPVAGGGTKWTAVTGALTAYVNQPNPNGVSIGIQYFGLGFLGASCNAPDYATPAVEIAPLPGVAQAFIASLGAHAPSTVTPTSAALQGAVDHASAWAKAHPGDKVIVVLATDGDPDACGSLAMVDAIAAAGFMGMPSIPTFVIGVGPSLGNLDGIAAAGGTTTAFHVDTNANVNQQFLDALNKIRGASLTCSYLIPKPSMGMLNYGDVNVEYKPGMGMPQIIPKVKGKAACPASGLGWYYDNDSAPTQIILCDATCAMITADAKAEVDVVLGCATITQ
jgi:hypothetical protein